jgi:hypothetical protein
MDSNVLTPDFVPHEWSSQQSTTCTCSVPQPQVKAAHKGAARTYCARCGLPMRIAFGER